MIGTIPGGGRSSTTSSSSGSGRGQSSITPGVTRHLDDERGITGLGCTQIHDQSRHAPIVAATRRELIFFQPVLKSPASTRPQRTERNQPWASPSLHSGLGVNDWRRCDITGQPNGVGGHEPLLLGQGTNEQLAFKRGRGTCTQPERSSAAYHRVWVEPFASDVSSSLALPSVASIASAPATKHNGGWSCSMIVTSARASLAGSPGCGAVVALPRVDHLGGTGA